MDTPAHPFGFHMVVLWLKQMLSSALTFQPPIFFLSLTWESNWYNMVDTMNIHPVGLGPDLREFEMC